MNSFVAFMASGTGRIVRIAAGIALIAWAVLGLHGAASVVVGVVGAVPLIAGLVDVCLFAPLFGAPLSGPRIRGGA
ncbi:MAG TPA: DUF2892 domain-containing protein [Anaerolineales bacterium]|nr:DUF2892 domain-containing protein [Anaerolineales bacterium]